MNLLRDREGREEGGGKDKGCTRIDLGTRFVDEIEACVGYEAVAPLSLGFCFSLLAPHIDEHLD